MHSEASDLGRRTRRAVRALAAAVALLLSLQVMAPADAGAAPALSASATPVSTSAVRVQWTPTADFEPLAWTVNVADSLGRSWGRRTACIQCRSMLIDGLAAGARYTLQVIGWGTNAIIHRTLDVTVPAGACAGVTGTCVSVAAQTRPAAAHVAQGFGFGTTERTDAAVVKALSPRAWRIAPHTPESFTRARTAGGDITLILSDSWPAYAAAHGLSTANPWEDWAHYRRFVTSTVKRHVALGMLPEYWEVQNEPDGQGIYKPGSPPTRALVLEQFRVAHDAIRSILPDARVVGPSLSVFRYRDANAILDLESFVTYAAAHRLRFDLAWHENGNNALGQFDGDPKSLIGHVEMSRQLLVDRQPGVAARVLINEYAAPWNFDQPGAAVGYMAALEVAGVSGAGRSCFPMHSDGATHDTCFAQPGLLDGLLLPDASTADTYGAHWAYASMTGSRLQTGVSDRWTSALSATDGTGVRALIGRHESCRATVNAGCPAGWRSASPGAAVTVKLPCRRTDAHFVRVALLTDTAAVRAAPTTVVARTFRCSGGVLTVRLPGLADGSVYFVVSSR